ncbi:PadR family transcriptional regulator [Hoeflea prorocentri]|uniref:PadR family transcriptional regulator n=1 Tax=Hoeflea prorocentri TaxID=1922333 RepID=A0A9X3UI89_9HYPH|nr:PadR family transcriptional regulator [Hoeflea prorocentri]MCY6381142.1 PadR family transcriptional regulator [Hoeflea prorocentri]MDA5398942.1 PadR family transcriptional regulator [Hoeflea prorocentri]
MALSHAILVCLTERPMSGYDLAKFFDTSIGFFWRATHPQIYREMKKLGEKGYVTSSEEIQSGKPNRIVYSISQAGRRALKEWSREPVGPPLIKDDLLVRLQAIEHVDRDALRQQICGRLKVHKEQLEQYFHIRDVRFSDGEPGPEDLGKLMGLELGIQYEQGWITWCESVLKRLG